MATISNRRWFQFSTAGLLVLMTVVAIAFSFVRRGALDQPTDVVFAQTPISDVLDYLSNKHNYNYHFDEAALAAGGIVLDKITISDQVTDVPVRETLERFLAPHGLGFFIENGELVVTTRATADKVHAGWGAVDQRMADLAPRKPNP